MALADSPPRSDPQFQAAMVKARRMDKADLAERAAEHVDDAVAEIAKLMKHARREGVRLKAAIQIIEWAASVQPDHETRAKVYVLATDSTADMAQRLRARLLAAEAEDRE